MSEFRVERDSMGEVQVPAEAYFGAQTQRAVENFPISGWELPPDMIHAMGRVKYACGVANRDLGKLTGPGKNPLNDAQVEAMMAAAREVADGKFDDEFRIDVFQTGSGTSRSPMSGSRKTRISASKPMRPNPSGRFTRMQRFPASSGASARLLRQPRASLSSTRSRRLSSRTMAACL